MNIFKQFYKSLYSPKDIASFRSQGIGKTILYVFFLTFLSILPAIYYSNTAITGAVGVFKETIKKDLPNFTIENGELHSPETKPITVNKGNFSIIFDSTGSMDSDNVLNTDNTLALLRHEIVLSAGGEKHSFPYSMIAINSITKEDIEIVIESSNTIITIFLTVFSIAYYLFSSAIQFIQITILALLGLLLKNITKKQLNYRELWRMTAYSVTIPTIFFTIMAVFQTQVPFSSLINWFVCLTVLLLAIQEVPSSEQPISD
ncbi:DUF1189 domain-containing protein [Bacillus sp. B15-48]|uniref:DUF1189 domain-containing protein n=1 Tax=Bacillus sp. B15-48 TaxID=1548601 RepID=UPI00193F31B6|nr:DUF1189 domain-containing protein [Bacillus sp. B15-48]MBM4762306.1 DUF1189 domain-containing protein [Bacillus sp. B15-48]